MFFFKKKKIHLDCFTKHSYVHEFFPIDNANKFLPDWWKKIPKGVLEKDNIVETPTMKICDGFIRNYRKGIILPLWSDLAIKTESDGKYQWRFADQRTGATIHPSFQRGEYLNEQSYAHLKILSPWYVTCKENVDFVWTYPFWNFETPEDIMMPPGIIDFKYQIATNINLFVKIDNKTKDIIIPAGQPMAHIIPMSERPIEIHNQLVSDDEWDKLTSKHSPTVFKNQYRKTKELIDSNEAKCPFQFWK
jgi:hypothetical protein